MTKNRRFYSWRKCSTCRDAQKALDQAGIAVDERDFFADPLSRAEIEDLAAAAGIDNLFSWRSPSAKPYRESRDSITPDELIDAMLEEPRLIRRPIITSPDAQPIIGFDRNAYSQINP